MHWAGGVEKWQSEAATWQYLDPDTALAVWEKQNEHKRESVMQGFQSATAIERDSLQARLEALPQQGDSGVVGAWIDTSRKPRLYIFKFKHVQGDSRSSSIRMTAFTTC